MASIKMFHTWKRFIHSGIRMHNKFKWIKPNGQKTGIIVYNSITKNKVPLILNNDNFATWYMCGPTVYDSCHIGHACTYVKFDIIRRIMSEFFDINVVLIMGMTDIDDKIIARSHESGQHWQSLTEHYENEFFSDMDSLNVLRPTMTCKVSKYIPEIIAFIKKIEEQNGAYLGKDGSLYFDTSTYKNYGKLNPPQVEEGHPDKKSSLDFSLWKASKANEPYWESPWGQGRPGWHIECSAIASTVLGNNIDIHSGGIDLAFPHHENEEAQSCCYYNIDQWINYWLHTGHLHLEGDTKMSKSLQNTISIQNLLKTLTSNQFRMFCLLSHYRNNVVYSQELINNAITSLKKIESFISDCNNYVFGTYDGGKIDEPELLKNLEETKDKINAALADDFHTPKVVQAILKLVSDSNKMLKQEKTITVSKNFKSVAAVSNYLQSIILKLGISPLEKSKSSAELSKIINILVDFRNEARTRALGKSEKDIELLKACDNVRKQLSYCGVDIKDQKGKSSWMLKEK